MPEIDGLRFVAIMLVVVFHLHKYLLKTTDGYAVPPSQDWLGRITIHWHLGVELFFIISGFVLALPFAAHRLCGAAPVSLKAYLLRRVTRLEPPYLLTLVLFFFLAITFAGETSAGLLPHLFASAFYVHNATYGAVNVINPVMWSLEIEVAFYLAMPLLALFFAVSDPWRRRSLIAGTAIAAIGWQAVVGDRHPPLFLLSRIQYFLMGLLLADIYLTEWKEAPRRQFRWDLVSVAGWPLLFLLWTMPLARHFVFPFAALLLFVAVFRGRLTSALFRNPWLVTIGGMCYTIYLLHFPFMNAVARNTKGIYFTRYFWVNLLLQAALFVPLLLAASAVFFAFVERPCMDKHWPTRLMNWLRARRPALGGSPAWSRSA